MQLVMVLMTHQSFQKNEFQQILILDQNQLGKCKDFPLTDDQIQDAMKDNPSGQGDELTPLILIRPRS